MSTSAATMASAPLSSSSINLQPPNAKRKPKLSLNTSCQSGVGKKSTSLNIDTLSAVSPTVRNTHRNAFEAPHYPPTPVQLVKPPCVPSTTSTEPLTPSATSQDTNTPSTSSSASSSPGTPRVPYALPPTLRSILTNSPLPRPPPTHLTRSSMSWAGKRQLRFPPPRRVAFRAPLAEEIRTSTYVAAHSDLPSLEVEVSPDRAVDPDVDMDMDVDGDGDADMDRRKTFYDEDSSSDDNNNNNDDDDGAQTRTSIQDRSCNGERGESEYPKTPIAGRRKRRREWIWTLGPIDGVDIKPPSVARGVDGYNDEEDDEL